MGVRQYLIDALEQIDASVFSGDLLYVPEERAELMRYMARWNREAQGGLVEPAEPPAEQWGPVACDWAPAGSTQVPGVPALAHRPEALGPFHRPAAQRARAVLQPQRRLGLDPCAGHVAEGGAVMGDEWKVTVNEDCDVPAMLLLFWESKRDIERWTGFDRAKLAVTHPEILKAWDAYIAAYETFN